MDERPPEGLSSREKILWAAASMLAVPGAALSVRAVAARAGVSTGSLQHHFPKQRELMDEVLALVFDMALPSDAINDSTKPARGRLVAALQAVLAGGGSEFNPKEEWRKTFDIYVASEPTEEVRQEWLAIERELHRRIEYCLKVLQDEGALTAGDNARRARFLLTVVNGLSIAQALPAEDDFARAQIDMLYMAVDYVFDAGSEGMAG